MITGARASDSGRYVCEATDGVRVFAEEAVLDIVGGGGGGGGRRVPPTVRIDPSFARADEGQRVEFACLVGGMPEPR